MKVLFKKEIAWLKEKFIRIKENFRRVNKWSYS